MNAPAHGYSEYAKALRRLARALTWPIRRVLDPRFSGVSEQITVIHEDAVQRSEVALTHLSQQALEHQAHLEALQRLLEALGRLAGDVERLREIVLHQGEGAMEANAIFGRSLADLLAASGIDLPPQPANSRAGDIPRLVDGAVTDVDEDAARLLNYAESHRGFAAQKSLWFNPPISLRYKPGDVEVADANERIAEVPYVFRALAALPQGARILDVGAAESTLAFSLASLGYQTTALDLRGYPLLHPKLEVVRARIEEWESEAGSFDGIVCLSTIEHIGIGAYGGVPSVSADLAAMKRMRELLVPGGLIVLTAPVGRAAISETERTYDRASLEALLGSWDVEDLTVIRRDDDTTWSAIGEGDDWDAGVRHVALVTARRNS
jgi:2-polyprenyl-3-methyl-5-hydroxy-6-metoxy-1,4-benzoquinol methylase